LISLGISKLVRFDKSAADPLPATLCWYYYTPALNNHQRVGLAETSFVGLTVIGQTTNRTHHEGDDAW
jgi:hypothetical protein